MTEPIDFGAWRDVPPDQNARTGWVEFIKDVPPLPENHDEWVRIDEWEWVAERIQEIEALAQLPYNRGPMIWEADPEGQDVAAAIKRIVTGVGQGVIASASIEDFARCRRLLALQPALTRQAGDEPTLIGVLLVLSTQAKALERMGRHLELGLDTALIPSVESTLSGFHTPSFFPALRGELAVSDTFASLPPQEDWSRQIIRLHRRLQNPEAWRRARSILKERYDRAQRVPGDEVEQWREGVKSVKPPLFWKFHPDPLVRATASALPTLGLMRRAILRAAAYPELVRACLEISTLPAVSRIQDVRRQIQKAPLDPQNGKPFRVTRGDGAWIIGSSVQFQIPRTVSVKRRG